NRDSPGQGGGHNDPLPRRPRRIFLPDRREQAAAKGARGSPQSAGRYAPGGSAIFSTLVSQIGQLKLSRVGVNLCEFTCSLRHVRAAASCEKRPFRLYW